MSKDQENLLKSLAKILGAVIVYFILNYLID